MTLAKQIRGKFSLVSMGDVSSFYNDVDEEYRGWLISLVCPNGGILAVDLVHKERGFYFCKQTHPEFDYEDDDGILKHAKELINQIEDFIASADNQQLTIPQVLEVKEKPDCFYPIEVEEYEQQP